MTPPFPRAVPPLGRRSPGTPARRLYANSAIRYDRAAVRWVALFLDRNRSLHLGDLRELADLLVGAGRHNQVAQLRLERWLKMRGCGEEADRVGCSALARSGFARP